MNKTKCVTTSPGERKLLFSSVCVCLFACPKKLRTASGKYFGEVWRGQSNKRLDFAGIQNGTVLYRCGLRMTQMTAATTTMMTISRKRPPPTDSPTMNLKFDSSSSAHTSTVRVSSWIASLITQPEKNTGNYTSGRSNSVRREIADRCCPLVNQSRQVQVLAGGFNHQIYPPPGG